MSGADNDKRSQLPAVQPVGYGSPPVEHRFKKGVSGNPRGRPRGSRNQPAKFNPADEPTASLILEEAYRPVAIREGDKVIELPAIQAVMRAMGVSAMKGNRLAQKTMTEFVQKIEASRNADHLTAFENALEYKQRWENEIQRCQAAGLPDPAPLPHPDDVIINMRTGTVRTEGPMSKEELAHWQKRLDRRAEAQKEVNYFAAHWRRARSPKNKDWWLKEWHFEQRIFDIINDGFPDRYKIKLENRSYKEGASREGDALKRWMHERKKGPRPRDADD
ncbi:MULTISPECIES: DUF5681 domain-containing protein [Sphingomonas]|uniref:DUF5681 domain-containing protein n=1 Tax=Sphingomonas TaxID=13687 RepID=UPI000DF005D7|nr:MULTISPECIES: DUF5681 domain-containing protein [Sphingomonas]